MRIVMMSDRLSRSSSSWIERWKYTYRSHDKSDVGIKIQVVELS